MLSKMIQIQTREGWPDATMAARLGIARSTWTDIRNGRLPLSPRVSMAAAGAFPELLADLLGQVSAGPSTTPAEAAS